MKMIKSQAKTEANIGSAERYVKIAVKFDENLKILRQNNIIVVEIEGFLDENLLYGKVSIEF